MTSNELKELVKKHFSLVEADAVSEEIVNEEFAEETVEETVEETFGEIADINDAFIVKFPGDSLQVGDKVMVVTKEGQEMDAPNGTHELKDGTKIVTEDSVVKEIIGADGEKAMAEEAMAEVEDVVEEVVEEVIEEIKDEMEEEAAPSLEEIVKEISEAVKEEMGYVKKKMAELEEKVAGISDAPAAAPVMKQGSAKKFNSESKAKFAAFDVSKAKNADRIESAIRMMKNLK
jgi:polyhydroxyalkanoate synthesis regulator phasin